MSTFLLKHVVDLSLLTDGFTIPTAMQQLVYTALGRPLAHGEKTTISVVIDGKPYEAVLCNINFSRQKYPDHPDLLQIRYTSGKPISQKLCELFKADYDYLNAQRQILGPRKQIHLPDDNHDEVALYATDSPNTFMLECFYSDEFKTATESIKMLNEMEFETFEYRADKNASIKDVTRILHVRQLDRSIGDSLKKLYDYRCQVSGERIGSEFDAHVVEAHHIKPFTQSLNNDTSNIVIISPNFHRIIHSANPTFNFTTKSFEFPNGVVEPLKLNKHL